MDDLLKTITELSHEFGISDFVRGGGGNTSCKTAGTLWVKPSGTTLSELTPQIFVAMDRAKLGRLFKMEVPVDRQAREALVKDVMAAAVLPGQKARPSVEAPLHNCLRETFVVHTHPALVNGMACAKKGAEACKRLFPEALWVPYTDPGFTLSVDVDRRIAEFRRKTGRGPSILILENHGIFVSGNSAAEIRGRYHLVLDGLAAEYEKAGIPQELKYGAPARGDEVARIAELLGELLGPDAAANIASAPFEVANGPISPDHIVYSKSYPYLGPLTKSGIGKFRKKHGYAPRVISTKAAVFGVGGTRKIAELALELARDGALLQQLAKAFEGIEFLSDESREFIENWEVESYRAKLMS